MKLLRYGPKGAEKPGLLQPDGTLRDLSEVTGDFAGEGVSLEVMDRLRALDPESLPKVKDTPRVGCALGAVPNFYCVGLNYHQHAIEMGMAPPQEPVLFNKSASCLAGPLDPLVIPQGATKLDWEVELGIVIGRGGFAIPQADALDHIAAYCVANDVSERVWQMEHGGQWAKGKSGPGFGPVGPWLVTPDEVADVQNLKLWLSVNGERMQDSDTSDMIFGVAEIVSYVSRFMPLVPGDLIATGTPEGVGHGMTPERFLHPGDVIELEIEGLGRHRQTVVSG